MEYRTLGLSGLRISAVGLGCMGMSHVYGAPADKCKITELLTDAVDMGYTFLTRPKCMVHICSIFLLFISKSKNGNILLDIIEVRCSGNDREISLNMPAKNYLDGRFTCTLAIYRMTD